MEIFIEILKYVGMALGPLIILFIIILTFINYFSKKELIPNYLILLYIPVPPAVVGYFSFIMLDYISQIMIWVYILFFISLVFSGNYEKEKKGGGKDKRYKNNEFISEFSIREQGMFGVTAISLLVFSIILFFW